MLSLFKPSSTNIILSKDSGGNTNFDYNISLSGTGYTITGVECLYLGIIRASNNEGISLTCSLVPEIIVFNNSLNQINAPVLAGSLINQSAVADGINATIWNWHESRNYNYIKCNPVFEPTIHFTLINDAGDIVNTRRHYIIVKIYTSTL